VLWNGPGGPRAGGWACTTILLFTWVLFFELVGPASLGRYFRWFCRLSSHPLPSGLIWALGIPVLDCPNAQRGDDQGRELCQEDCHPMKPAAKKGVLQTWASKRKPPTAKKTESCTLFKTKNRKSVKRHQILILRSLWTKIHCKTVGARKPDIPSVFDT